jgi:hypothetical protein
MEQGAEPDPEWKTEPQNLYREKTKRNAIVSQGQTYQYTSEDIRRYLDGRMTATEMHAMEKAALEDPFLADAMEGLEAAPVSAIQADMQSLSKKLQQRVTPAKVVPMRPERPWMAIAAASVILVGLAMTILYTNPVPQPPAIAKVETPAREEAAPIVQADSAVALTPAPSSPVTVEKESQTIARVDAPKPITNSEIADNDSKQDSTRNIIAATPEAKDKDATVIGYSTQKAKIDKESSARMRSVAPTAAPMADKAKKESPGGRIYTEPADGWSAWEVYVLNNLRRPKDPVVHGNIIVSFSVNPETGKPFDLKIDKGLHPLYDKEAIRLIKEGPVWAVYNTENAVKTTVTVVF